MSSDVPVEKLNALSAARGVRILTRPPVPRTDPTQQSREGVYELTATQWDERVVVLAPHPVTGELVENEHFVRHRKGDLVHLSDIEARRLLACGAAVEPGAVAEAVAEQCERELATLKAALAHVEARRDKAAEVAAAAAAHTDPEEVWRIGAADSEDGAR